MTCEPREIGGPLPEQAKAAAHRGSHARLLAGPGTGKTLTLVELMSSLVRDGTAKPEEILGLTFTRAAAAGLRSKIKRAIGEVEPPPIHTLHGFALRQLMKQKIDVGSGRGHVRVADDWEEREVILEDLNAILGRPGIADLRKRRLPALAAAWETNPDPDAEQTHPDQPLLGALREHKARYRYVLRSELVYRLKQELDANPFFEVDPYRFVIVDEYQDLNRCDVAVVDALANRGATLFVAGDDDQSIYQQLRNAHPQAIRDFCGDHPGASDLRLTTCVRCDGTIVEVAKGVISQEVGRAAKDLEPHEDSGPGLVQVLAFRNGRSEAEAIAQLAKALVEAGVDEHEIMVLLRSDHNGAFSTPIDDAMRAIGVPARIRTKEKSPLDTREGRLLLGYLRLLIDRTDDLAWRSVLHMPGNNVGSTAIDRLHQLAKARGLSFFGAVNDVAADPRLLPGVTGVAVAKAVGEIAANVEAIEAESPTNPHEAIDAAAALLPATDLMTAAREELAGLADAYDASGLPDFLSAVALRKDEEEDVIKKNVNIMTVHKAKGLDACVVVIAAADEELFPGPNEVEEERRLFYVSLTRARHVLFVTHALRREGAQWFSGTRTAADHRRTQFLDGSGLVSVNGQQYARDFRPDPSVLSQPSKRA